MTKLDPSAYELHEITTDIELVDFTRRENGAVWKGMLQPEDYVFREHLLGSVKMTKDLRVYLLRDNQTNDALCSIELLVREGHTYEDVDGEIRRKSVLNGCIGGVHTLPHHRKKGYAEVMVNKLVEKARDILDDGFLFLYSEVGDYYSRCGFTSMEVPVLLVKPKASNLFQKEWTTVDVDEGLLLPIGFSDFALVMLVYREDNEKEIGENAKKDKKLRVTTIPSEQSIDWYHIRAKYVWLYLNSGIKRLDISNMEAVFSQYRETEPRTLGFKLEKDGELLGFIAWTYDWTPEKFSVKVILIHVREEYDQTLRLRLLEYLQQFIGFYGNGFDTIEVWGSELEKSKVELSSLGKVSPNLSLSALQMMKKTDQEKLEKGQVVWENNNKLPWF